MNFFEHLRTFQVRILWQGHSRSTDGKHFLIRPILTPVTQVTVGELFGLVAVTSLDLKRIIMKGQQVMLRVTRLALRNELKNKH